jgi:hypothetical protein
LPPVSIIRAILKGIRCEFTTFIASIVQHKCISVRDASWQTKAKVAQFVQYYYHYRPTNMPWLYYLDETADRVLANTGITQQFTFPSSQLDFVDAAYALNGSYYGTSSVTGGVLQLCKNSASVLDAPTSLAPTTNSR